MNFHSIPTSQLVFHPFCKHNTQLINQHALLGNRISLTKMLPYHPFTRHRVPRTARAVQPMAHSWEQSSNGGQGRTQPLRSCPPHLQLWLGAGALRPFTYSGIRTRIPPLCQEAFRVVSPPVFAGSSLLPHGNLSLSQKYKGEEKNPHPQDNTTDIPKTRRLSFSYIWKPILPSKQQPYPYFGHGILF